MNGDVYNALLEHSIEGEMMHRPASEGSLLRPFFLSKDGGCISLKAGPSEPSHTCRALSLFRGGPVVVGMTLATPPLCTPTATGVWACLRK